MSEKLTEKWRECCGGSYEVSDHGRLRRIGGRLLNPKPNEYGYRRVSLHINGRQVYRVVHRIVLEAFIGVCPAGKVTNHKNGNKTDNRLDNLEYVTPAENNNHARRCGLWRPARGEEHGFSKLTDEAVLEMRRLARAGVSLEKIAPRYGVTASNVSLIVRGKRWAHIGGAL